MVTSRIWFTAAQKAGLCGSDGRLPFAEVMPITC